MHLKARSADTKEDEVVLSDISDALADCGGNDDNITGPHVLGWKFSNFNAAAAVTDDVALDSAFHLMPCGRGAGLDASAGDRQELVGSAVAGLDDVTAFGRRELGFDSLLPDSASSVHNFFLSYQTKRFESRVVRKA